MNTIETEKEIQNLKDRNKKVELDKSWEQSWTRRISIMVLTFIIASIWLIVIRESYPLLKAIVPTLGYLLSTLSIPQIKKIWVDAKK